MRIQFFAEILEDCLHRLDRGEDLQSVLERYPEHADRLRSLLGIAMISRALPKPKPSPRALNQGIRTLLARMNEMQSKGVFQVPEPAPQSVPIYARFRDWLGKLSPSRWIPLPAPAQRMMMVLALLVFMGGFATVGASAAGVYDFRFMPVRLNMNAIEQVINQLIQNQERQLLDLPGIGRVKTETRSIGSSLELPTGQRSLVSTPEDPDPEAELPSSLLEFQLETKKISPDILLLGNGKKLSNGIEEFEKDQGTDIGKNDLKEDEQKKVIEDKDEKDKDEKDKDGKDKDEKDKDGKDKDGKDKDGKDKDEKDKDEKDKDEKDKDEKDKDGKDKEGKDKDEKDKDGKDKDEKDKDEKDKDGKDKDEKDKDEKDKDGKDKDGKDKDGKDKDGKDKDGKDKDGKDKDGKDKDEKDKDEKDKDEKDKDGKDKDEKDKDEKDKDGKDKDGKDKDGKDKHGVDPRDLVPDHVKDKLPPQAGGADEDAD